MEARPPVTRLEGRASRVAVMCAALMAMLDISIVNVALNDIRASFGTPLDQIGWVSTGYMMANVVVIPMTGWLQRRFGYRRYFAGSILLFTVASALCGTAWNLPSLVAFRVLQGSAAAPSSPPRRASSSRATRARSTAWPAALRPRRGHRPAARAHRGRLPHRRLELALDLPRQRAGRHPRRGARVALHRGARLRAAPRSASTPPASRCSRSAWRRSSTCSRRATATAGLDSEIIVARRRRRHRAGHLRRARAGDRRTRSSTSASSPTAATPRARGQLPPRHRALLAARTSSRSTAAR